MRVVIHKSCALAAQTFMLTMANEKYDTCPMEGFDSVKVKRILELPFGAEINMIIACGIRTEQGIWGDRMRIPFEEIYKIIFDSMAFAINENNLIVMNEAAIRSADNLIDARTKKFKLASGEALETD